ncbi:MAG: transglycosylase SLT domain-containing protein [Gemmatimonadota bacterium]
MRARSVSWFTIFLLAAPLAAQSPLAEAEAAIASGQPWRASQLLAPTLANADSRTPEVVILGARAAAGWEGWSVVRRLLETAPWIDTQFDRLGRRLLAEAALAEQRNPQALGYAQQAVVLTQQGRSTQEQGERLLLLARAYDRAEQRDSAAVVYHRAAGFLPDIADWVNLRAAGVTSDSVVRSALLSQVTLAAAIPRVPWTEALARERSGDFAGAAARYDRLGARVSAARMRWRAAANGADSARVVASLIAMLAPANTAAQSREALDLLDRISPALSRDQRLVIARRAAAVGRTVQAMDEFAAAAKASPLTGPDRFSYGTVLGALNRWPEAARQFQGVTVPALAGHAAYFNARALLRSGNSAGAITALRDVITRFPRDSASAATALFLLGDLAIDGGQPDSARARFLALAERYPAAAERPRAVMLAALIAFQRGDPTATIRELTGALARNAGGEGDAMRYWIARARFAAGDTAGGQAALRELLPKGPESYYALRAAARLDTLPWRSVAITPNSVSDSLRPVFARAARLDSLGLDVESRLELDRLAGEAQNISAMIATGQAFVTSGLASRAQQLGARASAAGAPRDATLWQLLYPLPFESALRATAERAGVDPMLAASVIRQESGFVPHATSRTDARGLMQIMPPVGRELARGIGLGDFDPALLWIPDVNLALGMRHFSASMKRYPDMERALAAYNAGGTPVDRWSATPLDGRLRSGEGIRAPIDDIELFIERIPYVETRDYVRIIIRNYAMYQLLYGRS